MSVACPVFSTCAGSPYLVHISVFNCAHLATCFHEGGGSHLFHEEAWKAKLLLPILHQGYKVSCPRGDCPPAVAFPGGDRVVLLLQLSSSFRLPVSHPAAPPLSVSTAPSLGTSSVRPLRDSGSGFFSASEIDP